MPMVGTKGCSDPPGEPCLWQIITNQITAQLASPPRRYPRPSAPPWSAGYLWVPRVPVGTYGPPAPWSSGHHCYHQGHHGRLGHLGHPGLLLPPPHRLEHHIVFAAQANQHLTTITTIFLNLLLNFLSRNTSCHNIGAAYPHCSLKVSSFDLGSILSLADRQVDINCTC